MKNFTTHLRHLCCCLLLSITTTTLFANTLEPTEKTTPENEAMCTANTGAFTIPGDFITCPNTPVLVQVSGNETEPDYNTLVRYNMAAGLLYADIGSGLLTGLSGNNPHNN